MTCLSSKGVKSAYALIFMEFFWSFDSRKVYFTQSLFHPKSQLYGYSCGTINKVNFEQIVSYLVSYFYIFMQTQLLLERLMLTSVFLEGQFVIQLLCSAYIQDSLSWWLCPIMKFPLTWTLRVPRQILLCHHIYQQHLCYGSLKNVKIDVNWQRIKINNFFIILAHIILAHNQKYLIIEGISARLLLSLDRLFQSHFYLFFQTQVPIFSWQSTLEKSGIVPVWDSRSL